MLRFQVFQFVFCILIYSFFGLIGLLGFLASAFMGVILLEAINYIQHYGLSRKQLADGTYEKLKVHHSWNSNHELGRIILFELTRHPDHHTHAGRKYQILRHHDHVPQLPAGYMSMIPLAFIPPLWFRIMNPLSIKYQEATHI